MAVSKRTRYEVLRRDNHTCRYCGGVAPDVKLTVDHVMPLALGGSDKPANLVTACRDCNAGKSSTGPSEAIVEQVSQDALRWAAAVKAAGEAMVAEGAENRARYEWFLAEWRGWDKGLDHLPDGWDKSLDCWLGAGLPQEVMVDCLDRAVGNRGVAHRDVFAYMGGIARKRVETLHEAAKAILETAGEDGDGA